MEENNKQVEQKRTDNNVPIKLIGKAPIGVFSSGTFCLGQQIKLQPSYFLWYLRYIGTSNFKKALPCDMLPRFTVTNIIYDMATHLLDLGCYKEKRRSVW